MICGKTIYTSRTEANKAMTGINADHRHRNSKDRLGISYFCTDCKGWHVASKLNRFSSRKRTRDVNMLAEVNKKTIENNKNMKTLTIKNFTSRPI